MISDYNRLSGLQKVAILFSILGESLALNLVKELDKTELRKIRAAMRGVNSVAFAVKKQVMEEFYFSFVSEKFQEEEESDEPKKPFAFLDDLTDEQLIALLITETPRVIAITLAQLSSDKRMLVLNRISEEEKGQVLLNIGNLDDVPLEAVVQIANKLQKKSRQLPKTVAFSRGGGKDLADLLGEMEAEDEEMFMTNLEQENLNLKIQLQELGSLRGENIRLRKITRESITTSKKQTIVKVINNSASPNKKVVLIDKGKSHGIYIGQNVIGTKGLVGQIIEVNSLSSKVVLITEPSHDVPGQINRTGEKVIISGSQEKRKLIVNYANTNSDIKEGDVVSTSGIGNRFKPMIPINKIIRVSNELNVEFKKIEIIPFENPENMPELILIWDYKPKETNNE